MRWCLHLCVSMECIRHVENTSQEPSCTSASIDVLFSHVQPMCTPIPSKPGVRLEQALLMKLLTKRCKHKLILNYPKFTCMDCKAQLVSRSWSLHSFVEHLSFPSLLSSIMDLVWLYEMASKPACVSMPTSVSISASLHFIKFWSSTKEISIEALSKWHTYMSIEPHGPPDAVCSGNFSAHHGPAPSLRTYRTKKLPQQDYFQNRYISVLSKHPAPCTNHHPPPTTKSTPAAFRGLAQNRCSKTLQAFLSISWVMRRKLCHSGIFRPTCMAM